MRKILFLVLATFVVSTVSAQIAFEKGTFSEALEKAKKENKKVFMDCYTSWCGPCKMLAKDIFPNKEVGDFMNGQFINLKMDMEKGEGVDLKNRFKVSVFPTLLIINPDGTEFSRTVGADDNAQRFIETIKKSLNNNMDKARAKFKTSLDGANEFIQTLNDSYLIKERDQALVSVFSRRKASDNYSAENFVLYENLISTIYHPVALSILSDYSNAIKFLGKKAYTEFVSKKVNATLTNMAMSNSLSAPKIDELVMMSKKYKEMQTPLLNYFKKIANAIDDKDIEEIIAYSSKNFKKLNLEDRGDVARFVHRITVTNGQLEKLIPFYEKCKSVASTDVEMKKYDGSLELVKKLLTK